MPPQAPVRMSIICKEWLALNAQLVVNKQLCLKQQKQQQQQKPLVTGIVLWALRAAAHLELTLPSPSSAEVGHLKVATH